MTLFTTALGLYGGVLWSGELQGFIIHEAVPTTGHIQAQNQSPSATTTTASQLPTRLSARSALSWSEVASQKCFPEHRAQWAPTKGPFRLNQRRLGATHPRGTGGAVDCGGQGRGEPVVGSPTHDPPGHARPGTQLVLWKVSPLRLKVRAGARLWARGASPNGAGSQLGPNRSPGGAGWAPGPLRGEARWRPARVNY
jgi:hypothetical protein